MENISVSDLVLLGHATFGVLGSIAAVWVFVEALNAQPSNARRIRAASISVAVFMIAAWIAGGYWYLHFYPPEKALILNGPWPFAHNLFMETKEHLFLATLILSLYLPIAARDKVESNRGARKMVLCVAALIVLSGLAVEGAGAIVNHGAKMALTTPAKSQAKGQ